MVQAINPHAHTVAELRKLNETMEKVVQLLERIEANTYPRPNSGSSFSNT